MDRHLSDQYVKKTKIFEYRSRAAFKLLEIHQKYKLLRPGQKVLDVGSSPGGWSQIIAEYTKSTETDKNVIAVDILHMDSVNGVYFIQGNINKQEIQDEILNKNNYEKFDLILSDMCPEFTGIKSSDHVNLIELNKITIDFALKVLKRKGNLVIKTFEGTLQKKFQEGIKKYFNKVNCFKPSSSRSDSSEMFLVCISYLENENLRQEAEEITKLSAEEYFEQQKNNAIREYKIAKLNNLTLLEDLDKMKEEILNKFKIDPDKLKLDEKEEKELRKIIDDENEKIRQDLYGRSYKPIPKNKSLGQFIDDYQKEMKDIDEKLRTLIGKDKVEMDEYEQFFKEDADEKHLDEITESRLKEVEFLEKNIDALEKSIKDEDANELLRKDGKENEILAKYKRWEKALDDYNNEITEIEKSEVSDEISGERIKEGKIFFVILRFECRR